MKHILLILILAAALTTLGAIPGLDLELGLGLDFPGNYDYEVEDFDMDEAEDTEFGFSPYAELLLPLGPNLLLGGGLEYQIPRSIDADDVADAAEGDFGFIPIYATGKFGISMIGLVRPELIAQIGYNFFTGDFDDVDLTGGLYWGIGAGVKLPMNITTALIYRMHQGGQEMDDTESDVTVSQLTMRLGYRF